MPLGRNQLVFSSRAGRERRNPLEVPSAPSSDVQPFAACSQRSQFALQPAASLSALQGCQTNSVIVLHPVEAEIIKSVFFFSFSLASKKHCAAICCVNLSHRLWLLKVSAQELLSTLQKWRGVELSWLCPFWAVMAVGQMNGAVTISILLFPFCSYTRKLC